MSGLLGVVLVGYNSSDVIADVLESLFAAAQADAVTLSVVFVDNASTDDTLECVRDWAKGLQPYRKPDDIPFAMSSVAKPIAPAQLRIIEAGLNGGFAGGVNIGVEALFSDPAIMRVWVLNPDSAVPAGTPAAITQHRGSFGLLGGRVVYLDGSDRIQIDGGMINRFTGVTHNVHQYRPANCPPPQPEHLDFITGASMVVSRAFYEAVGPMREDYFLYYEEVDWALRRGDLPLAYCPGALVYHRGGTAIGSPVPTRPASPFSLYFKHRARLRFVRRHFPRAVPTALAYSCAKAAQLAVKGYLTEAWTILYASFGRPPSKAITARLGPEAAALLATFDARK